MPGVVVLVSRKAVRFAHVDEIWPSVSDRLHHGSEHGVSRGAQADITSHDSAIQMKVSSGWIGCKSSSFYVESLNLGIFFLSSLKFSQLRSTSPLIRFSFSEAV